ncbi:MAG: exosome complex RNA-binding protein Csl4 [Methanobrevibacter sp.]|jgi:exosome complex component CSL4|nr:exosome complex RNA-binding protein Csl4 [Candidatus Methanovirga basalitermitum]
MMDIEHGDFVMPGDVIGVSEQYLPGDWTYEDGGYIKAAIIGNVSANRHEITIIPKTTVPVVLKVDNIVVGQITDIKGQRTMVDVQAFIDSSRELALPYSGAIHVSQVKKGYLEKLTDAFRIGDIVEGKVIKIMGNNIDINTEDPEHGVLKAMCSRCRNFMVPTNNKDILYCEQCNRKEKRKISLNYDY